MTKVLGFFLMFLFVGSAMATESVDYDTSGKCILRTIGYAGDCQIPTDKPFLGTEYATPAETCVAALKFLCTPHHVVLPQCFYTGLFLGWNLYAIDGVELEDPLRCDQLDWSK